MRIARIAGMTLLVFATAYALNRFVRLPLYCARVASVEAATIQASSAPRAAAMRARESLRGCECVTARGAHVPFILGGVLATLGDDRAAIAEYERALTIERSPEIYFALGVAQLDAMQRDAAVASFARACAFDPSRLADIPDAGVREDTARALR
jgi:tetratricopeptide (TPR) repeat protein